MARGEAIRPGRPARRSLAAAPTWAAALALAGLVAAGAAAPAHARPGDGAGGGPDLPVHRIVAEVNGAPVTAKELNDQLALDPQWLAAVKSAGAAAASERPRHERMVLERLIDDLLLTQEAEVRGLTLSPEEEREVERLFEDHVRERWGSRDQLETALEERGIQGDLVFRRFRGSFLGRKVLSAEIQKLDSFVPPSEIRTYYDKNADRYRTPNRLVYRHIWVDRMPERDAEARQRVDQALAEIAAGKPWNEVCKTYHDGANKDDGGRQEPRDPSAVIAPLRAAVAALAPGETSPVIEIPPRQVPGRVIPGAYVVVRLEERSEAGVRAIAEVEEDIRKHLREARHDEVWKALVQDLRKRATIRIRLGDG